MKRINTKQLAAAGLMAALVLAGTMLIQVPTPTKGYIHIGDSMVYLCGIMLAPVIERWRPGGSLLADVFSGYGIYAPPHFLLKPWMRWPQVIVTICYLRENSWLNRLTVIPG